MKQIKFNYESFFNTIRKREENKKVVEFKKRCKTEVLNTNEYILLNGEMCLNENATI